jgi:hypothetical protein
VVQKLIEGAIESRHSTVSARTNRWRLHWVWVPSHGTKAVHDIHIPNLKSRKVVYKSLIALLFHNMRWIFTGDGDSLCLVNTPINCCRSCNHWKVIIYHLYQFADDVSSARMIISGAVLVGITPGSCTKKAQPSHLQCLPGDVKRQLKKVAFHRQPVIDSNKRW